MRIAVATIAKDEAQHVERWALSAKDADHLCIADTGSRDGTVEAALDMGVLVSAINIDPWRFDAARNAGWALIPPDTDVVITLDMDEILIPGWRDALEAAGTADRYHYHYQWSPDVEFRGERCVTRRSWRWKHPVHETLEWIGGRPIVAVNGNFAIAHLPDDTKPRSQYLPLLELAAQESPDDDRIAHYYARELFFRGDWARARQEFIRHLSLPSAQWADERAQSYRYLAKMDDFPERWLLKAVAEAPHRREPWVDLAELYASQGDPDLARQIVRRARRIAGKSLDYMTESAAWDEQRLAAIGNES